MGSLRLPRGRPGQRQRPHADYISGSINPADIDNTGLWVPDYVASPWEDQTGSNDFAEATNPPVTGSAVNGFVPSVWNGTNTVMRVSGGGTSLHYSAAAYGMACLIYVNSFTRTDPGAASPYQPPTIFGSDNGVGSQCGGPAGSGSSGVFRFGHHDGTAWKSAAADIETGVWTMVKVMYDGNNIGVGTNGDTMNLTAAQTVSNNGGNMSIGVGNAFGGGPYYFDGMLLTGVTFDRAPTDQEFAGILEYWRSTYGLPLA